MDKLRALLKSLNKITNLWAWVAIGAIVLLILAGKADRVWGYSHSHEHHFPTKGSDAEKRPHVTIEPGDQKANMGMYDDAQGPPLGNVSYNAAARTPIGMCNKPAIEIGYGEIERGGEKRTITQYADDEDVIWRCWQTTPVGELKENVPPIYCYVSTQITRHFRCYHDYVVVYAMYSQEKGRAPVIGEDEVQFAVEAEHELSRERAKQLSGGNHRPPP